MKRKSFVVKKLLSIILVICMLASMSIYAFAEDAQPEVDPAPAAEPAPIVAIPAEPAAPAEEPAAEPDTQPEPDNQPAPVANVELPDGIPCDTLQEAVTAAGEGGTVSINETAEDIDIGGAVVKDSVTIDLNGNDVTINNPTVGSTGTVTIGMQLLKESEQVTINGDGGSITFDGASSAAEKEEGGNPWLKRGVQNYTDLTLDNVTIDGTDLADNYGAASDKAIDFNPEYENTVISNCNGGLVVDNGASILAAEGDNAIAVSAYTNGGYKDGPSVVIEEDAGTIQGTIVFDGDEGCEEKVETAPSLTIEGGIFNNFLLKIGNAVSSFVDNIKISGGSFDSKNVEDNTGNGYVFEDFLQETYVVVEQDGRYVVMTQSEADALKKPVIAVVPTPAPEYIPEPAPAPKPAAKPAVEVKPVEVPAVTVTEATQSVKVQGEEVKVTLNESTVKVEMGEIAKTNENKAAPNVEVVIAVAPEAVESKSAETVVAALKELVKEIRVEHVAEDKEESTISASDYKLDVTEDGKISLTLSDKLMSKLGKGIHEFVVTIGGMEIVFTIEIV